MVLILLRQVTWNLSLKMIWQMFFLAAIAGYSSAYSHRCEVFVVLVVPTFCILYFVQDERYQPKDILILMEVLRY